MSEKLTASRALLGQKGSDVGMEFPLSGALLQLNGPIAFAIGPSASADRLLAIDNSSPLRANAAASAGPT
jgi:hypothetical protein